MFRLIKQVFVAILSTCTTGSFDGSLASNSKEHIKCVSLKSDSHLPKKIVLFTSLKAL